MKKKNCKKGGVLKLFNCSVNNHSTLEPPPFRLELLTDIYNCVPRLMQVIVTAHKLSHLSRMLDATSNWAVKHCQKALLVYSLTAWHIYQSTLHNCNAMVAAILNKQIN